MKLEDNEELFVTCEEKFGFQIDQIEPIDLGWLNRKWVLQTNLGQFVLKKYHVKRYKDAETLLTALSQQQRLFHAGVPCPVLLESEGTLLHTTDSGDRYIMMQYCQGDQVDPGTANISQMYELGRVAGEMHRILNDGTLGPKNEPQFVMPEREQRLEHWDAVIEEAASQEKTHLIPLIKQQKSMAATLNLDILRQHCRQGWGHRDLWMDNILFGTDSVSAVLDFDRLHYDYPELDVARAILSGVLYDDQLDVEKIAAFLRGYREIFDFPFGQLVHSIRLLWYLESKWWIRAEMDTYHRVPDRFASEMIWIASHHEELDELLAEL
ncbi:phosphotransferase enzyme family protein [Paenibacillus sp. GCM10027626]|uniref:phosphotransferase enzyme family protein n=1 Tax=Paenibacillus sp. GCM10027626 TaxID=3273411 RepID=UPI00362C1D0B